MLRSVASLQCRFVSYLYVPRHLANERVSVLIPHFEFDKFICNLQSIESDLKTRNYPRISDIFKVDNLWQTVKNTKEQCEKLENDHANIHKANVGKTINDYVIIRLREIKHSLKSLAKSLSDYEQELYEIVLNIPNHLHPRTPKERDEVIREYGERKTSGNNFRSHIAIGRDTETISFSDVNPNAYYLEGDIAHLELALLSYFSDQFHDFQPFSNPHMCKSLVAEGVGLDIENSRDIFLLHNSNQADEQDLNLVGGASLPAFCAYFTKSVTPYEALPFRAVTTGRSYLPREETDRQFGLYRPSQSSDISFFVACENDANQVDIIYKDCVERLQRAFEALGIYYRTVIRAATALDAAESSRTEIQLWSPYFREYFPVAFVSSTDDYISKRLLMYYGDKKFLNLIYGKSVSVPVLIVSLVEQAQNNSIDVPVCLKKYFGKLY